MKIAIITDGGGKHGLGHFYQSVTLAKAMVHHGVSKKNIFFITKSDAKVASIVKDAGFKILRRSTDQGIFSILQAESPDHIVFDKLNVAPSLARRIKTKLSAKLTIMTNLTQANLYADVVVLAHDMNDFSNIVTRNKKNGKVEFFGPKYWMLRSDFYDFAERKRKKSTMIEKIILMFGGTDPTNFSSIVLDQLLRMNQKLQITLVLGAGFTHQKKLKEVLNKHSNNKSKICIVQKINNVAERMFRSDLALVSPGLTFFESLMVGTPVLVFHHNEFQRKSYEGVFATLGKKDVEKLPLLIKNKKFTYPSSSKVVSLKIGKGRDTIVKEILG